MDYTKIPIDRRNLERIIVSHPGKSVITKERLLIRDETLLDKGVFTKMPAAIKDGRTVDEIDIYQIRLNQTNFNPMLKKIGVVLFAFGIFFFISLILGYILPKDKQIVNFTFPWGKTISNIRSI